MPSPASYGVTVSRGGISIEIEVSIRDVADNDVDETAERIGQQAVTLLRQTERANTPPAAPF